MEYTTKEQPHVDTEENNQVGPATNLDEGEIFLLRNGYNQETIQQLLDNQPLNKALIRKFIDKTALAYSAVFDLFTSTNMSSEQYSWLASIFYLAYLVAEYPWSLLAQKTKLGKVIAGNIIAWGSMLMITAACSNFTGMAICRFLLGVFEAFVTPCFMLIVGMWYTRDQQPFRAGVFYSCNGLGAVIGGVLTYGIGHIKTIAVWKAIFLILGGVTACWGIVVFLFLPDDVMSTKRFDLNEKALLISRSRLDRTGVINHQIKWYQIREALLDPQVWILFFFVLFNEVVNGGVANFSKLIIKGLTNDPLKTIALAIPFGGFQIFWVLSGTFLASRVPDFRSVVMFLYLIPTIIGNCLLWKLSHETQKIGVLFGYYILGSYVCSVVLALQMPVTNLGGYTKRNTGAALVFIAYCVGNVVGPHAFLAREAPIYQTGCKVILACSCAQAALALCLSLLLMHRNKKRDEAQAGGLADHAPSNDGLADLTDFENPSFRYVL